MKRSDVRGNRFEWLLGENNVRPPPRYFTVLASSVKTMDVRAIEFHRIHLEMCYSEVVFHSFWWFRVCPIRIYSGLFAGRRLLGLCLFTADNVYCLSGTPDFTHPASSIHQTGNPANTGRWPSAESTSAQRHRRCADVDSALQDGYPPFSSDQHHWHRSVLG